LAKANQWVNEGLPFVVYRYPNDSSLRGIFQDNTEVVKVDNFDIQGFVFAPYDLKEHKILTSGDYLEETFARPKVEIVEREVKFSDEGKAFHIQMVKKAITEIKEGNLQKVVLSRAITTETEKTPLQILEGLLSRYDDAFCYWWYHPKVGMWLGATPEQLLKYQSGTLWTTSLAGTLPVEENVNPKWTSKEREEQQMVTDFIQRSLLGKVNDISISETVSHQAGKLWHLKSTIKASLRTFTDLGGVVGQLHPTPAVCGLPKEESLNFILRHEGYDRQYYTGYLGPINLDEKESANLFVNLRCLKYAEGQVDIFVGGGVTGASKPEEEWSETQYKSRTILEVL
jgi:isochorismate synthase